MSDGPVRIDGHLDLAHNAVTHGRDLALPLDALREREGLREKEAMVTLPEIAAAGLDVVVATLFVLPSAHADQPGPHTYEGAEEARALASKQLDAYERWEDEGRIRILHGRADLEDHLARPRRARPPGVVLLMEGAAPLRHPAELSEWTARGVRLLGPAWKRTPYAGGTGEPGGLTPAGVELMSAMTEQGVVLDVSHLAEEAFWQALEHHQGPVVATHANARALVDSDRHLSDAMLDALAARDAVVGIVLADKFLRAGGRGAAAYEAASGAVGAAAGVPAGVPGGGGAAAAPVNLRDVARQAEHVAGRVGWARVAVGSDLDGGFGRRETPVELDRLADFERLAEAVPQQHADGFLGGAWLGLLRRALPG